MSRKERRTNRKKKQVDHGGERKRESEGGKDTEESEIENGNIEREKGISIEKEI